jgi:hypothetical protein
VPHRSRFASRLTLWAFVAALALKSAVPMLAAVAAGLQGMAVAEICDVYGVATTPLGHAHAHTHGDAQVPDAHGHANDDASMAVAAPAPDDVPAPGHRHGGRAGDHCALTGLVAIAAIDPPALAGPFGAEASYVVLRPDRGTVRDAAARWAALLGHGPPAFF